MEMLIEATNVASSNVGSIMRFVDHAVNRI